MDSDDNDRKKQTNGDVEEGKVKWDEKRTAKTTAKTDADVSSFSLLHRHLPLQSAMISCGPLWSDVASLCPLWYFVIPDKQQETY